MRQRCEATLTSDPARVSQARERASVEPLASVGRTSTYYLLYAKRYPLGLATF